MILDLKVKIESGDSVFLIRSINCFELKEVDIVVKFRRWKKRIELWFYLGGVGFRKFEVGVWEFLFIYYNFLGNFGVI